MAENQIKLVGDFHDLIRDFRAVKTEALTTAAAFDKLASYADKIDLSHIAKGGVRAANALKQTFLEAAKLSTGIKPMDAGDFRQRLYKVDRDFAKESPEFRADVKGMLRDSQQRAIRNALESTVDGVNDVLKRLVDSIAADRTIGGIDANGNAYTKNIGDTAKEAVAKIQQSVAIAATNSLEFIDKTALVQLSSSKSLGLKSADISGVAKSVDEANQRIQSRIVGKINEILAEAEKNGVALSKEASAQIETLLGNLSAGKSRFYSSELQKPEEITRIVSEIDAQEAEIRKRIDNHAKNLTENLNLDALLSQIRSAKGALEQKGALGAKSAVDTGKSFRELNLETAPEKLKAEFDAFWTAYETAVKKQVDSIVADISKGNLDMDKVNSLMRDLSASGVSKQDIAGERSRIANAIVELRRKNREETERALQESLKKDAEALDKIRQQIETALQSARLHSEAGVYTSQNLSALIEKYKEKGGQVREYLNQVERINTKALEERIRKMLASDAAIPANAVRDFKIDAARFGANVYQNNIRELLNELTERRAREVDDAIVLFNEEFSAALFKLKQDLLRNPEGVSLGDFEAKWSRKAIKAGTIFDKGEIERVVAEATVERFRRDTDKALAAAEKAQQSLLKSVEDALRKSSVEGGAVSNANELAAKLRQNINFPDFAQFDDLLTRLENNVSANFTKRIQKLKEDALELGRAISTASVKKLQGEIESSSDVLSGANIKSLVGDLNKAVAEVDRELRERTIENLRNSIRATSQSLQGSAKQLRAELAKYTATADSLGVRSNDGIAKEISSLYSRTVIVELEELLREASVDASQIYKLRSEFSQAGGSKGAFASTGIAGITSQIQEKVRELISAGKEFPEDLQKFYENLYDAVGPNGEQLENLKGYVAQQAATVNANAQTMSVDTLRAKIKEVYKQANTLGQVVSKTVEEGLMRQWQSLLSSLPDNLPQGLTVDSFKSEFSTELLQQKKIRSDNALKQMLEGIWKPYAAELDKLAIFAQSETGRLTNPEAFTGEFIEQLNMRFVRVQRALEEQISRGLVDKGEGEAEIARLRASLDNISKAAKAAIAEKLEKDVIQLNSQLVEIRSAADKTVHAGKLPDIGASIERVKTELVRVESALSNEAKEAIDNVIRQYQIVQKSVADSFSKRNEQMLRSQVSMFRYTASSQYDIRGTLNAAEQLAREVEKFDQKLANQLRNEASAIARKKLAAMQSSSAVKGKGGADALGTYGLSEGSLRNFRRMLPMQITDIVVGLSTGQSLMYVILQQGGQLKDMFGGIGNAVKEVAKYLLGWTDNMTKFQMATAAAKRVLAGIAVGAIAGMAILMKKAADFNAQIRSTTVELKFKGIELSGDEFRAYSEQMSRSLGIARTDAAALFKQIAIDAKIPKEAFESLIDSIDDISTALGNGWDAKGLQETTKALGELFGKDGFKNFKELAADYALFTDEQYKSISAMYEQGDAAKAGSLAIATLRKNVIGAKDEAMTPFQKAVDDAKRELLNCLQVVGDGGPWQALFSNLASAAKGFLSLIGPISKAANAVLTFIGIIGNSAVKAGFTLGKWGTGAEITGLERRVKAWEERAKVAEAEGDYSSRDNAIAQHAKELKLLEQKRGEHEAIKQTIQAIGENQTELMAQAAGLNEKAKEALKTTTSLKAATAATGKLKVHPNSEGDKPGKRGGGRGSRVSDAQKELEAQQKIVQQLQEEYDQRSKMGKLAGLEYDLANGKIKLEGIYLDQARELAKKIDERVAKEAEELRLMERNRMEAQKMMEVQNKIQEYALQAARMSNDDSVVDYYQQILEYENQLTQRIREYNFERQRQIRDAMNSGRSGQIDSINREFNERIALERQKTEELKKIWDEYYRYQIELGTDWLVGFEKGLNQVAFKVKDLSSEVASAVESWADQMGDALATFVRTGKFDFKSLVNSILDDIARIAANNLIRNLVGGFKFGFGTPIADSGHEGVQSAISKFKGFGEVQRVWVENFPSGLSDIGSMFNSTFSKDSFSLGSFTSMFGNSSKPLISFSSATQIGQQVANRAADEIVPVVNTGAKSMFSTLTDGLGDTFSKIFSGLGSIFSSSSVSSTSGSGGGFWSSLFSIIGSIFTGSGHYKGGYTGPGGKYTPAGIVHAGEYVINAASTRKLGLDFLNRLNGYADGGYVSQRPSIVNSPMMKEGGAGLEVNIYNNGNNDVRAQRNSSGGLDIFIEQAVNAVAGSIGTGGAVAAAMQRAYGLNRGVGTPRTGY